MHATAARLLDAHVVFELEQWQGAQLIARAEQEVRAFWAWAASVQLGELTTAERINAIAERLVLSSHLPEGIAEMIGKIARPLVALPLNRKTRLSEVIGDELFGQGVDLAVDLRRLREEGVRRVVNSPAYTAVVSEVLYRGIADYVTSSNPLAERAPAVASLLSKGAGALSKRAGLEGQLEKRLRAYIDSNSDRIAHQSEKVMLNAVSDDNIRKMAAEAWAELKGSTMSVSDVVDDAEVDAVIAYGYKVWQHLRQTPYVAAMVKEGIARFFAEYGGKNLVELMEAVGVREDTLLQEAREAVPQFVDVLLRTGFVEAAIRRRLEPFYASGGATALLG